MNKAISFTLILIIYLSFYCTCLNAQQWSPPNNQVDFISRTGPVNINGNVGLGIGTTSPIGKLQVYGSTIFSGSQGSFVLANAYQTGDHFMAIAPNSGGTYQTNWDWTKALGFFGNTGELQKSVTNNSDIAFSIVGASSSKNFRIFGSGNLVSQGDATILGNVIIGNVTAPVGYKMFVQGGILTEKLKVALSNGNQWGDYVFDPEYKLMSISEVDFFIQKNKRLPGFASAKEIFEAGGIDVSETIIRQQEKIEELYLYIIQLNAAITELSTHIIQD